MCIQCPSLTIRCWFALYRLCSPIIDPTEDDLAVTRMFHRLGVHAYVPDLDQVPQPRALNRHEARLYDAMFGMTTRAEEIETDSEHKLDTDVHQIDAAAAAAQECLQLQSRCLIVGRVLVEFFMHQYMVDRRQVHATPSVSSAAWDARAVYKPWKSVLPIALYRIVKTKLTDPTFTERVALSILQYYLEERPSEKDMCVIFICTLRLPKGVDNRWRTKLLGDSVPFLLNSDVTETANRLALRHLVAMQEDDDDAHGQVDGDSSDDELERKESDKKANCKQ